MDWRGSLEYGCATQWRRTLQSQRGDRDGNTTLTMSNLDLTAGTLDWHGNVTIAAPQ